MEIKSMSGWHTFAEENSKGSWDDLGRGCRKLLPGGFSEKNVPDGIDEDFPFN